MVGELAANVQEGSASEHFSKTGNNCLPCRVNDYVRGNSERLIRAPKDKPERLLLQPAPDGWNVPSHWELFLFPRSAHFQQAVQRLHHPPVQIKYFFDLFRK
jgi:hypothetical protein